MVWAGICFEAHTELCFIDGNLNMAQYIEDVLAEHVVPFGPFIGADILFMHGNAWSHTALIVSNYLDDVGIRRMEWSAHT